MFCGSLLSGGSMGQADFEGWHGSVVCRSATVKQLGQPWKEKKSNAGAEEPRSTCSRYARGAQSRGGWTWHSSYSILFPPRLLWLGASSTPGSTSATVEAFTSGWCAIFRSQTKHPAGSLKHFFVHVWCCVSSAENCKKKKKKKAEINEHNTRSAELTIAQSSSVERVPSVSTEVASGVGLDSSSLTSENKNKLRSAEVKIVLSSAISKVKNQLSLKLHSTCSRLSYRAGSCWFLWDCHKSSLCSLSQSLWVLHAHNHPGTHFAAGSFCITSALPQPKPLLPVSVRKQRVLKGNGFNLSRNDQTKRLKWNFMTDTAEHKALHGS